MPKSFGYLNQGNPLTIRDNEAQEMINCAIERGWIEYKDYPVPTGIYDCVPNREVKLPSGAVLRLKNDGDYYCSSGKLKLYNKSNDSYSQFGVVITSEIDYSVSFSAPTLATSSSQAQYGYYCECKSSANVGQDIVQVTLPPPQIYYNGNPGSTLNYDSNFTDYSVVKEVSLNNLLLDKSQYTILMTELGLPVVVLATPTSQSSNSIEVKWNYAFHDINQPKLIIKESQNVFYAATIKDIGTNNNYNSGFESIPVLRQTFAIVDSVGFAIGKVTATIPSDTNAQVPQLNIYRMPLGGSEYLFDFSTTTNISNRLDSVADSDLGSILETEGNSQLYLLSNSISILLHNDRLFLAQGKLLVFSKPTQFNEFPAENFYAFSEEVVDICKYDSNLAVFTKTKSYIIYGAGTDGFVIAEVDWKTLNHIRNCAQSIYTKLVSLVSDEIVTVQGEELPSTKRRVVVFNHRYAQDISLRVKDSLNKGVAVLKVNEDLGNRNTSLENRYYVAELRYYESANAQVKTFNLVYDVLADGFCIYDPTVKDFNNQVVFKYRTKEFKMVTPPSHQAQYHKGIYVKGKGTFKVNVYSDGELLTSLTHTETDNSKPMRIILHNMGNKRGSTISLEFIGTQGAQIHDWEVYD